MRRLRGWMPKSDTALRPCFWILCAAFGLGILLGQLAGRSLGVEQQDALASYLRRYAALCASAERPVQSALSAVLTYLRGPAAAFLLGLVGPGVFLLPALSALQGFFLSYSVACFAAALGRGGVKLALCAFGVRCAFILPCTFFLAAWGMRTAYARLRGPKKRRAPLTGRGQDASRAVRAAARRRGIRGADRRAEAAAAGTRGHHIRGGVEGS